MRPASRLAARRTGSRGRLARTSSWALYDWGNLCRSRARPDAPAPQEVSWEHSPPPRRPPSRPACAARTPAPKACKRVRVSEASRVRAVKGLREGNGGSASSPSAKPGARLPVKRGIKAGTPAHLLWGKRTALCAGTLCLVWFGLAPPLSHIEGLRVERAAAE